MSPTGNFATMQVQCTRLVWPRAEEELQCHMPYTDWVASQRAAPWS